MTKQHKDPADSLKEEKEIAALEKEGKSISLDSLSIDDLMAIPENKARTPHPFEGYPHKMVKDGDGNTINATHLVMLSPKEYVHQDPSGNRVSQRGKNGKDRIVNIPTSHNRIIVDYGQGGINLDVVFDIKILLADGKPLKNCAFVKSAIVRAQLIFFYDTKAGRISVDRRYLLADSDQVSRLRQMYQSIINPKMKAERDAAFISNESETSPAGMEN